MPKAYVVTSSISDPEKFAAYANLAPAAVAPFGASFLARGNAAAAYENGRKERIVIVEYPSLENATAAPLFFSISNSNSPARISARKRILRQ
jgi:uncharacterized protein (DUF1330 family)